MRMFYQFENPHLKKQTQMVRIAPTASSCICLHLQRPFDFQNLSSHLSQDVALAKV